MPTTLPQRRHRGRLVAEPLLPLTGWNTPMADPARCSRCNNRLPNLTSHTPRVNRRVATFKLEARDLGDAVDLFAAESYTETSLPGDSAVLDLEHARVLRDWLSTWLDRQIGPM